MDPRDFGQHLDSVRRRMTAAAGRAARDPSTLTLVAVTKGHDFSVMELALDHGLFDLGENRVQEALPKLERLGDREARVHLIGQLQTNKVNKVVGRFASIMGVDRPDLLERIDRRARSIGVEQSAWIQVNCSGEDQKAGCDPADAKELIGRALDAAGVRLVGLMTMARAGDDESGLRRTFAGLRDLRDRELPGGSLSMGMSDDFEVAIEEGATHVRLGTVLFGPRGPRP
jgi:pyridoxal phosphate enzyme (YggS family)